MNSNSLKTGNLNKSKKSSQRPSQRGSTLEDHYPQGLLKISPFGPHLIFFSKNVSYEANLAAQFSHLESKFWSERGDFNSLIVLTLMLSNLKLE